MFDFTLYNIYIDIYTPYTLYLYSTYVHIVYSSLTIEMPEHQGIKGTRQIKSIDAPDRHPTSVPGTEGSMSVVAFDDQGT